MGEESLLHDTLQAIETIATGQGGHSDEGSGESETSWLAAVFPPTHPG